MYQYCISHLYSEKRGEINEIKCQQISIKIKREKLSGDLIENTIKPNSVSVTFAKAMKLISNIISPL